MNQKPGETYLGELIYQNEAPTNHRTKIKYHLLAIPAILFGLWFILNFSTIVSIIWLVFSIIVLLIVLVAISISVRRPYHVKIYEKAMISQNKDKEEIYHFEYFQIEIISYDKNKNEARFFAKDKGYIHLSSYNTPNIEDIVVNFNEVYSAFMIEYLNHENINFAKFEFGNSVTYDKGKFMLALAQIPLENLKKVTISEDKYFFEGIDVKGKYYDYRANVDKMINLELLKHIVREFSSGEIKEAGEGEDVGFSLYFLSTSKMKSFEKDNEVSEEKQRLLTFCSILMIANGDSPHVFAMRPQVKNLLSKVGFSQAWGIKGREDALETVIYLARGEGHAPDADENLKEIEAIPEWSMVKQAYIKALEQLFSLGYTKEELDKIETLAAWDYGRSGFIARNSVKMGYLTEEDVWVYMQLAAYNATQRYESWREYLAAYVLGRALGYGRDCADMYSVLEYLLNHEDSPFFSSSFRA
ncbi:MAG: DUF1266 domain-containing protein [Defluviitaleaceae bacterium]|nr:DUF1266 domain-containing protein [Defluviitaleaceae bacterium]